MSAIQSERLISVIMVLADSGAIALESVARVLANDLRLELILIDNASSDNIVSDLAKKYATDPRIRIIYNETNIGFGPACNRAAATAQGDSFLILNPDCYVATDTLVRLRNLLDTRSDAGVIGANIYNSDGKSARAIRRREPSLMRAWMTLSGLSRFESRYPCLAGVELPASMPTLELEEVEVVSGALLFLPRGVFERIGGFDVGYFLHCEDVDLCRRVRDSDFKVLFARDVSVSHVQGSSSRHRPLFVAWHKHRGMWRYFRKFDSAARYFVLRYLVWLGIWTHFLVLLPVCGWRWLKARIYRKIQ